VAEYWQAIALLVSTAWRADRKLTFFVLTAPIGNVLALMSGLWLALITNGMVRAEAAPVVIGVVGLVIGVGVAWQLDLSSSQWRMVLSDKVAHAFDIEIARICAALPGLEHHERATYQDKLELLTQRQGLLGQSMGMVAITLKAVSAGITVFVLLVVVHPLMLLLVMLALPSLWIARLERRWRTEAEEESATPARLARHLRVKAYDRDAGAEIRVFGLADEIRRRATDAWNSYRRPLDRAERRISLLNLAHELLYVTGVVVTVGFVLWRAIRGVAAPGDVVLSIYLTQQVQSAVIWPIQSVSQLGQALRTAGRFLWLRRYASGARRTATGRAPTVIATGITFENVSFRYPGSNRWVLRNVSLSIPAGSVVAVVGSNGVGKTTLVKLLTRMYEPTEGRILVDGVDLADIDVDSWRQRTAAAFQDFATFEFTAQHSVGAGDISFLDDEPRVVAALDQAGACDVREALPSGMQTMLGTRWDGVDLSSGQWQKLALGRALMRSEPLVVFFDEPTASLDAHAEHALFERYAEAARAGADRGAVTVLVSHRFSTVRSADQIIVLSGQRVAEYGTHDELLARSGLYARLFTLQARSYLLPGRESRI
jgi:ATP-binding cassette subfamily B protein